MSEDEILQLKKLVAREKRIMKELISLESQVKDKEEGEMVISQSRRLRKSLKELNDDLPWLLEKISVKKSLPQEKKIDKTEFKKSLMGGKTQGPFLEVFIPADRNFVSALEKKAIKRVSQRKTEVKKIKERKVGWYAQVSNSLFADLSERLVGTSLFRGLRRDLVQANIQIVPESYISVILFTTMISFIFAFGTFLFLSFFTLGFGEAIISIAGGNLASRMVGFVWILFLVPIATFLLVYFYPNLERRSYGGQIDRELPFATLHMASISGSMLDPTKIFNIIIETKEYPALEKIFTKLINEINVYGYDLVTALRDMSYSSPSDNLSEIFNGLSTTINSGGDISNFFNQRSQSLLFEHKLQREKHNRDAETFMDIYISVVIAAPMILMLLLIMMKLSGLGVQLSTGAISLLMILGVVGVNILFLTFLQLKKAD